MVEQTCSKGQANYRASYSRAIASNFMRMKNVVQELRQEIDYLAALAEMYRRGCDIEAQAAALEAKAALERLVRVINGSPDKACPELPAAA